MTRVPEVKHSISMIDVLEAEFELLHHPLNGDHGQRSGGSGPDPVSVSDESPEAIEERLNRGREYYLRKRIHGLADDSKRSAICLSGGGVRSATFSLGVIQALAANGWLGKFHYMSSVSGGGYIASWLSSWIARSGGNAADIIGKLAPSKEESKQSTRPPEPMQVRQLRRYSNYLSPVHGFSIDMITLVATFARNLVLHWMVLLPLLGALILLPRLNLSIMLNLRTLDGFTFWSLLFITLAFGIIGFVNILRNLPNYSSAVCDKRDFFYYCYVPIFLAMLLLSWLIPALYHHTRTQNTGLNPIVFFSACGLVLLFACKSIAAATQGKKVKMRVRFNGVVSLCTAGALSGLLLLVIVNSVAGTTMINRRLQVDFAVSGLHAVATMPALLAVLWICMTAYVGMSRSREGGAGQHRSAMPPGTNPAEMSLSNGTGEEEREWWARASAYIFWSILAWLLINFLVIVGPWLALKFAPDRPAIGWAGSAGALGVVTGAYGYWSKNGAAIKRRLQSAAATVGDRIFELIAAAFIIFVIVVMSFSLAILSDIVFRDVVQLRAEAPGSSLLPYYENRTISTPLWQGFALLGALALLTWICSRFVGANTFSLHSMYGNRLVRAYMGASNDKRSPDPFSDFDVNDNCNMGQLLDGIKKQKIADRRLFHVVNIALNLVKPSRGRLDWQHRKAASFTVSPLHAGANHTRFQESKTYTAHDGISLARAMTISGAAASPNMGYHTSMLVAFAMTFFNIRLGWWLPNPGEAGKKFWGCSEPKGGMVALTTESLASTTDDSPYVYLSDGGHFENLGLYEMVRRRCHHILVVDAGCDPNYQFEDLENAIRKIRIDFGISIVFPNGLPTPTHARTDVGRHQHSAIGTICYSDIDGDVDNGTIIYMKPLLSGDEPTDISRYAALAKRNQRNPFPHHPTGDQFFDEVRFESYGMLGYHSVMADNVLGTHLNAGGAWPKPVAGGVDAVTAAVHANADAAIDDQGSGGNGGGSGIVASGLATMGIVSMQSMVIPVVAALGLAAIVALGNRPEAPPSGAGTAKTTPAKGGADPVSPTGGDTTKGSDINLHAITLQLQPALVERFTNLLTIVEKLEQSTVSSNENNAKTISEMHQLLIKEIELLKLANRPDRIHEVSITLDVLNKFRTELARAPIKTSDPGLIAISNELAEIRKILAKDDIVKKLDRMETSINRLNPRTNVRAVDGGRP